jgi:hypothetical protein
MQEQGFMAVAGLDEHRFQDAKAEFLEAQQCMTFRDCRHPLAPGGDRILHELLLGIVLGIDCGYSIPAGAGSDSPGSQSPEGCLACVVDSVQSTPSKQFERISEHGIFHGITV